MKILLINQPLNNRGDEAAHKALIRTLLVKIPNIQIKVLYVDCCSQEGLNQFKIPSLNVDYVNIKSFWWYSVIGPRSLINNKSFLWPIHPTTHDVIKVYSWADFVVCAPGGICMGGFQNWEHLFFLKLAKYCKKPLIYYGRSIGPFPTETKNNRLFKKISLEMLDYMSFIAIRDLKSNMILKDFHKACSLTVDTAFLEKPNVSLPYEIKKLIGTKPYIVFVPNYLLWHYAYKNQGTEEDLTDFFSNIGKGILKQYPDCNIVMLPQTFANENKEDNDIIFFRKIAEKINDNRILLTADCYSSDIQQTLISKASFLVGARYHSIVFAINQNIPFISLSYEHKMTGLLQCLDLTEYEIDIQNIFKEKQNILNLFYTKINTNIVKPNVQEKAQSIAYECTNKLLNIMK